MAFVTDLSVLETRWPSLQGAVQQWYVAADTDDYDEFDKYVIRFADRLKIANVDHLADIVAEHAMDELDVQEAMVRIGALMGKQTGMVQS